MGIKLCPIDGDECAWWQVPQECDGLTEEYESCRCIHKCEDYERNCSHDADNEYKDSPNDCLNDVHDSFILLIALEFDGKVVKEFEGDETDWNCSDRNDGDGERSDTPELLFCISGEGKVPCCTMNGTEEGAKDHQEQGVQPLGMRMFWDIERRDV